MTLEEQARRIQKLQQEAASGWMPDVNKIREAAALQADLNFKLIERLEGGSNGNE